MKLIAFQIKNFRSIIDTGFQTLSPDNITALIGQNESGKTTILEALWSFEEDEITEDDLRDDDSAPEVVCVFKSNKDEVNSILGKSEKILAKNCLKVLEELDWQISLKKSWADSDSKIDLENETLLRVFQEAEALLKQKPEKLEGADDIEESEEKPGVFTSKEFADHIFKYTPQIILFEDESILPAKIDISEIEDETSKAEGRVGALNYLGITGISVEELRNHKKNERITKNKIEQANKKFSEELQSFWSQILGSKDKITVAMEVRNYDHGTPAKVGQPYLLFWVKDQNGNQKPVQRSKGVQWFLSFFLSLKTTARKGNKVVLVDEPGSNLHARAQTDILKFFEKQKENLQIIYATHSPYLLDVNRVYRVLAIERREQGASGSIVTEVYSPQKLGGASNNTLFPLYTTMGMDISHQQVIKKTNNVLLEEISAFYYFKAFKKLFNITTDIHFLPATGVSNIPLLANLLLGWGINFSVVVDDDKQGRTVFKELKDNLVLEDSKLIKIKECDGVEDLFDKVDFCKFVLCDESVIISDKISKFVKDGAYSKPLLARDFLLRVEGGKVALEDFSDTTKDNVAEMLSEINKAIECGMSKTKTALG